MEEEKENLSDSAGGVRISITRASWSGDEEDPENPSTPRQQRTDHSESSLDDEELEKTLSDDEEKEQLVDEKGKFSKSNASGANGGQNSSEDEEVARAFENGVSISGEKDDAKSHANTSDKEDENEALSTSPQVEVVGDRVLIERDGKFELVDVKDIKAEYFEMLGISPDDKFEQSHSETSDSRESTITEVSESHKASDKKARPKTTTLDELLRRNAKKQNPPKNRSKSAKSRSRMDEFAHIKSPYGMTDQQIEIKRKREEAIARRKKEEEERRREEARRKREDAERAFEAWLNAKKEETRERHQQEQDGKVDPNLQRERSLSAQNAYEKWLNNKRAQTKVEQQYERSRRDDEAAQYLIRDRGLCDEAFRRWIKKKNAEARAKSAWKKKRKPKLKRKEQPPHNSDRIRYYEYYGYRNAVVH